MDGILGGQLPFFILMFVVVYFFMIRPQIQRTKKEKRFAEALKKGDKVITKSGLHAKILDINEDGTVILESGAGKMKFEKSALSMEMSAKIVETSAK
ncbi:MAG: preprotein translocase subunit YajC [Flavobacteriaceae bacterium]|nr:preprotein translocase subunit YajC [Flavobacteriaceae bacterium]